MDAFIQSFSVLSRQLLPILGAIALVFVIILLIKLIKIMGSLDLTVGKTNKTIDLVDLSIEKVQEPLNTAVKVSHTVDKAHDATISAVTSAKDFIVKSASEVKDKVVNTLNDKDELDELREPSPEDIIRGEWLWLI